MVLSFVRLLREREVSHLRLKPEASSPQVRDAFGIIKTTCLAHPAMNGGACARLVVKEFCAAGVGKVTNVYAKQSLPSTFMEYSKKTANYKNQTTVNSHICNALIANGKF